MTKTMSAAELAPSEELTPHTTTTLSDVNELWEQIHRDLIEWMTEGTHPHRIPRADHG